MAGRLRSQPDAMSKDVRREILYILRVDLRAAVAQQGPYLCQPAPADDRSRRCSQVDPGFDERRGRTLQPGGIGVERPGCGHQTLDVFADPLMEKDEGVDLCTQLDDALLGHE